jgi:hypothetical protein
MSSVAVPPVPPASFPLPKNWPTYLERVSSAVDCQYLDQKLLLPLGKAAMCHYALFGEPLYVAHGHDGVHAPASKHYTWKAVDLRVRDKDRAQQDTFLAVLSCLSYSFGLAVFDERMRDGEPHFHVEEAN